MRNAAAYEVRNLRKIYSSPQVVANDGVSFAVDAGRSFGLLGPNGAGKSTVVKQLVGLLRPTSGEIRLFGEPIRTPRDRRVGRTVAYLPQGAMSLGEFRVGEALEWTAVMRGCGKATARVETEELLEVLGLSSLRDRQLRKLSGGQKRITQVGMTLVGRLPVLILDEPTADIDPSLRARIWELISARARAGASVILVTHDVAEAEHILDSVAILVDGRIAAMGTPAELKSKLSHRTRLEVVIAENATVTPAEVATSLGGEVRISNRRVSTWVPADEAIAVLEKVISSYGQESLEDAHLVTPTLEDVYMEVGPA